MSFFGLTSFGPENLISSSLINSNGFTLYSDEEYKTTFNKMIEARQQKAIRVEEIPDLMFKTLTFKPMEEEVILFKASLKKENETSLVSFEEITAALAALRGKRLEIIFQFINSCVSAII